MVTATVHRVDAVRDAITPHFSAYSVGRVSVCEVTLYGYKARGIALCHPEDKNLPYVGNKLALSRALKKLGRHLAREANREINRRGKR